MIVEHASGTQAATVGTEHVLGTVDDGTDGVYQLWVQIDVLQAGDRVEFAVREAATATAPKGRTVIGVAVGPAVDTEFISDSFILLHRWDFTLTQTHGTGRSFSWSIRRVG